MQTPIQIKFFQDNAIYPVVSSAFDSEGILTYFIRMEDNSVEGFRTSLVETVFYGDVPDMSFKYGQSHFRVSGIHNIVNHPIKGSIILLCGCDHCREGKKLIVGMPNCWLEHDV
jgi:hypothetical protein